MSRSGRVAANASYARSSASARSTPPARMPLRPRRLRTAAVGSARSGRGCGSGAARHGSAGAGSTGGQPRQSRKRDGSRSIASATTYASAATCLHAPIDSSSGHVQLRRSSFAVGASRAPKRVSIRCASWTDCCSPAAAAWSGPRPRTARAAASQAGARTVSAASATSYSLPVEPVTRAVIRPSATVASLTAPARASRRPRSARCVPSSGTAALASQRAHGPAPIRSA